MSVLFQRVDEFRKAIEGEEDSDLQTTFFMGKAAHAEMGVSHGDTGALLSIGIFAAAQALGVGEDDERIKRLRSALMKSDVAFVGLFPEPYYYRNRDRSDTKDVNEPHPSPHGDSQSGVGGGPVGREHGGE